MKKEGTNMITGFEGICLYVHDQDEALDFYVNKLGFEKRLDMQVSSDFRWVMISPPGTQGVEIVLYRPGPQDGEDEAQRLLKLVGKHPRWAFLTENCQDTYEELRARGVPFISPPAHLPHAIEALFEDPYGNVCVLHERPARNAQ
jgi:catechol 2,3-dioxygenase-like lactoylglutathione lyase family enzyme